MEIIEPFTDGILQYFSKVISDYRTAPEISELIKSAGYPDKSMVTGTKWRFLYALFKEFNKRRGGRYRIAEIIQNFSDPTRWIDQETNHKQAMHTLNKGLFYTNLQLNKDGKLIITKEKIDVTEDEPGRVFAERRSMTVSPVFKARPTKIEPTLCFVLMPFQPSFNRLFREVIRPAAEAIGLKCLRADDFFSPTPIMEDIWTQLCKSSLVVADVTGRNPNVFYEIGIAHTLGKPVTIITQNKADIPFDIAHYRYFVYSDDADGRGKLVSDIMDSLTSLGGSNA